MNADMSILKLSQHAVFLVQVATPVICLFWLLPAWKRLRHVFLANYIVADALALYIVFLDIFITRVSQDERTVFFYWATRDGSYIVGSVFGVIGTVQLISYLKTQVTKPNSEAG